MKSKKDLVNIYYHKNCSDGFGSAWAAYKYFGKDAMYIPISHHDDIVVRDNSVNYFLDIAPRESLLKELESYSKEIHIIDHHISCYEYLKDKPYYHFNIDHSGCVLTWKYFFPDKEIPPILKYVEDRDIWKKEFEETNEVFLFLNLFETDFDAWDRCNDLIKDNLKDCIEKGSIISKYRDFIINKIKKNKHILSIAGYRVWAINSPFFQSYMLSEMYEDQSFMACYYFDGERYTFSLRSSKDSFVDLSEIAKIYGGGGHKNAAGFSVKKIWHLDILYYKSVVLKILNSIIRFVKKRLK